MKTNKMWVKVAIQLLLWAMYCVRYALVALGLIIAMRSLVR